MKELRKENQSLKKKPEESDTAHVKLVASTCIASYTIKCIKKLFFQVII